MGRPGGRIRITASMDVASVEAGAKRAERSIDGIGDAAHRTNAKIDGTSVSFDRASESTDRYSKSTRNASRDTDNLSKHIQGVNARFTGMRNAVSLIKWPALIAGAGYAAEGLGSLSAGAVALTSALAPLSGALVAYPALLGSFAQGLGVAQLAIGGVKSVLGEMSKEQVGAGETAKQSAKAQEAAAEGVRSAERQLTQAQVGAKRAQTELTQARKEAVENLKDLKNAAVDAGFGEQRAAMSLHDAKAELKKALAEPGQHTNSELESLELGVKEARQGLKEARLEKQRADREAAKGEKQGVAGSPKYLEAKRQLGEANLAAAEAARGLVTAEKAQKEALEESGGAAGKLASKLESLPAATQKFAKYLFSLKPQLKALQGTAANGLLPGVEGGIQSALKLFPRLKSAVGDTGKVMGGVAKRAGELVGSKGFGRDFSTIAEGNTKIIGRMGNSGLKLADALRHVLVAGQPLLMWMAKSGEHFATWIDNTAKTGRETGKLGGFFDKTRGTMEVLGSIFKNVATGLLEIGKAAFPLGNSILKALNGQAEDFAGWTQSLEGKNALRDYFQQAKPGIFEVGRLVKDLGGAFLGLSNNEGFYTLTHEVRTQLVPVFKELLEGTTKALGPALVQGLVQLGKLFGSLGGSSGPLVGFVNAVTGLFKAGNWMVENIPGFRTLAITIGGIAAVSKAMKFVGMVSGLSTALDLAKRLLITVGAIDSESKLAGGAQPFFGGSGWRRAPSTVAEGAGAVAKDAGAFGEKQALRDVGLIGGGAASTSLGATIAAAALPVAIGGIGIYKIATHTGHEMGNKIASGLGDEFESKFGPALGKALRRNDVGKLTSLQHKLREALNIAIASGADESSLEPIRKKLHQLGREKADITAPIRNAITGIRLGALAGLPTLNSDLREALSLTSQTWHRGTGEWRQYTVEAMKETVRSIQMGMENGRIKTKEGKEAIKRILGQLKIAQGSDPLGLAKSVADSFQKAHGVTQGGINGLLHDMSAMPKGAREQAQDAVLEMANQWAKGHPKIEAQVDVLRKNLEHGFGKTNDKIVHGVEGAVGGIAGLFDNLGGVVGKALEGIGINVNGLLKSLGVSKGIHFGVHVVKAGANAVGHAVSGVVGAIGGHARGGEVTRPMYMVGEEAPQHPEWVIATNPAYKKDNVAYWVQAGHDLGIPGFRRGGLPHPQLSGPEPLRSGGQHAIDVAYNAANKLLAKHQPRPGSGGSVIPIGRGLDTMDGKPVAAWIDKILIAARKAGVAFTVSSGYRTDQEQTEIYESGVRPAAVPKSLGGPGSRHEGIQYPLGAVDISPGAEALAGWLSHSRYANTLIYAGSKDPVHFSHPTGGGYAKGGKVGYTSSDIKHSGTLTPQEWAIAMLLGGFPAKPGVIAAGLGTIKSESSFDASQAGQGPSGHIGGWAESPAFGSTAARLNPILSSAAAFKNWKETGGFWQAWGQWEAEQSGLSGGGAGAYGHEFMGVAEEVIKGIGGAGGRGSSKPKVKKYPAGHTGKGGGTYGSPGPATGKPPHMTETVLPGLAGTPLEPAAHALPAQIQAMLKAPGLTFAQKLNIGELAGTIAGGTHQRTFDAEGHETSADSHADDIAAAKYQKGLVQADKKRVQKRLNEIAKKLKEPHTKKQERTLLAEQSQLLGKLGTDTSTLQGLNETIHQRPEAPEGGEEGEGSSKAQEETNQRLEELISLQKEQMAAQQQTINVIQSNSGSIISSLIAVINGGIGGRVSLGFQTPSVAGSLATY